MATPKKDEHGQLSFSLWLHPHMKNALVRRAREQERTVGQQIKYYCAQQMAAEDKAKYARKSKK